MPSGGRQVIVRFPAAMAGISKRPSSSLVASAPPIQEPGRPVGPSEDMVQAETFQPRRMAGSPPARRPETFATGLSRTVFGPRMGG